MLEAIREFVYQNTGDLTDGQFFGFALLLLLAASGVVAVAVRVYRNWRIDAELQRQLRDTPHGGLYGGRKSY